MAKYQMRGLEEYARYLQEVGANTPEICGEVVYAMADVVANAVRKNLSSLPTVTEAQAKATYRAKKMAELTSAQKKGLEKGFGISPMRNDNGYWNVKLGFDGYNNVKTRKYPKGQPNVMIARAVESGSSARQKRPFIRPAVNAARKPAIEKAKIVIDQKIYAIKGGK